MAVNEIARESPYSDASKLKLKNALVYFERLLADENLIAPESSNTISRESVLIGEELYRNTVDLLGEKIMINEDELIHVNETCEEESYEVEEYAISDN